MEWQAGWAVVWINLGCRGNCEFLSSFCSFFHMIQVEFSDFSPSSPKVGMICLAKRTVKEDWLLRGKYNFKRRYKTSLHVDRLNFFTTSVIFAASKHIGPPRPHCYKPEPYARNAWSRKAIFGSHSARKIRWAGVPFFYIISIFFTHNEKFSSHRS